MNDTTHRPPFPDRLSIESRSPYYNAAIFEHDVGIKLNGKEGVDVEEYCISEGWVRVAMGKSVDRHGNPLLMKIHGTVEPFFKDTP